MSYHVAVLITSERCGHCKRMRGSGRLLSQNEIKKDNLMPTIPGGTSRPSGYHYDAIYMKRLLTAGTDASQRLRLINVHYKSFNPTEGIADICIFNLEGANIKQTILKESNGKTAIETYLIGESGRQLEKKEIPSVWSDSVKANVPINITMYAHFFPILTLFHIEAWNDAIQNSKPVFGYVNGLETKLEAPYGALQSQKPNVVEFGEFLKQFFDGTRKLEAVAPAKPVVTEGENTEKKHVHFEDSKIIAPTMKSQNVPTNIAPNGIEGAHKEICSKLNFKLYVKE
jgi:hypothetical protein